MVATPPITLWVRDLGSDVGNAKTTFSSWDGCMAKTYCKWPVIVAIIIASLIVISILTCLVRCCCCGLECCCGIFSCCNACCPSPRGGKKRSKYADGPPQGFQPSPYQGYQPQAPPSYAPARSYDQPAQFATFDASKKGGNSGAVNGDALPAMPSWQDAQSRRVEDNTHHEEVEMDRLGGDEQKAPMLAHQAPSPSNNNDGFGAVAAAPYQDRAARNGGDLGNPYGQDNYGEAHDTYGAGAAALHQPYGNQQSPYTAQENTSGQQSVHNQQGYDGTAYGVVNQGHRSPPPQSGPYGQQGSYQQQQQPGYGQQTSYGIATARSPVSPMSPEQRYGSMSPSAQTSGVPASLVPARGNTPQAPQPHYQSYNSYGPSEASTGYTAYAPSSTAHSGSGAGLPAPHHSDSWRNV